MISSPPTIQTQLGEAISIIADSDFWERWDTLVKVRPGSAPQPSSETTAADWDDRRTLSAASRTRTTR